VFISAKNGLKQGKPANFRLEFEGNWGDNENNYIIPDLLRVLV
jgi:hypothetical protein